MAGRASLSLSSIGIPLHMVPWAFRDSPANCSTASPELASPLPVFVHALEPNTQCQVRLVSVLLMPSWDVVLCSHEERQGLDPHALKYQMIDNELQMRPFV